MAPQVVDNKEVAGDFIEEEIQKDKTVLVRRNARLRTTQKESLRDGLMDPRSRSDVKNVKENTLVLEELCSERAQKVGTAQT